MIIVLVIVVYADGFVSKSLNCHVRACCLTNHLLPPVIYHSALVLQAKETSVCTFLGSTISKLDRLQRPSLVIVSHALYCPTKDPQRSTVRAESQFLRRHHYVIYYIIQWSMIHIAALEKT